MKTLKNFTCCNLKNKNMKTLKFHSLPVSAVILYMGFAYYSTIFIFIQDWLSLKSSAGLFNALVFSCLAFMCVVSFVSCVVTDPGHIPAHFVPEIEDGCVSELGSKRNSVNLNLRYCDKCSLHKPPRAHHCRVCKRCVLRMDHHCLWINNCVGFSNYKPFVLLIFYAAISCIYSMVVITSVALQKDREVIGWSYLKIFCITCGSITAVFCITLASLLVWHLYLLTHNMTTIEYHEGVRAKWLARKSGQSYHHPFDLGVYKNLIMILGPNKLKWLWPTAVGHLRDGISFPTSRGTP
ncbi:hypothetical protein IFM89_034722 [Coptis chinensis]|uniref:S-acyltransferase n=1 Tax=Coptis chinensis TaxID=261450 RepID=A0A835HA41_9MAGN|nr:hypothetical protein IFM89_034722 [Coptis chinensis]